MSTIKSGKQGDIAWASEHLVVHHCPDCFITFAIPQRMHEEAVRRTRASQEKTLSFCCPNGHQLSYPGLNEEQRLREQLQHERDRSGFLSHQLDQTEARRVAQKAATTRARNERDKVIARIKNGVCPCCNRSFKNVRRHMASQHPEFDVPEDHD